MIRRWLAGWLFTLAARCEGTTTAQPPGTAALQAARMRGEIPVSMTITLQFRHPSDGPDSATWRVDDADGEVSDDYIAWRFRELAARIERGETLNLLGDHDLPTDSGVACAG